MIDCWHDLMLMGLTKVMGNGLLTFIGSLSVCFGDMVTVLPRIAHNYVSCVENCHEVAESSEQ